MRKTTKTARPPKHTCGAECRASQGRSRGFETHARGGAERKARAVTFGPRHPNSKAAGRRLVLAAQAQEDLLTAANAALAEMERMDGLATGRARCKRGAYLGLRNALWHLDALDR